MLDCGVLPSFHGLESLPWLGEITPSEIDIVFITHFHLDHAAALPHFTERLAGFRGRIFATHATIACMKLMLSDFVRVTGIASAEEGSRWGPFWYNILVRARRSSCAKKDCKRRWKRETCSCFGCSDPRSALALGDYTTPSHSSTR